MIDIATCYDISHVGTRRRKGSSEADAEPVVSEDDSVPAGSQGECPACVSAQMINQLNESAEDRGEEGAKERRGESSQTL